MCLVIKGKSISRTRAWQGQSKSCRRMKRPSLYPQCNYHSVSCRILRPFVTSHVTWKSVMRQRVCATAQRGYSSHSRLSRAMPTMTHCPKFETYVAPRMRTLTVGQQYLSSILVSRSYPSRANRVAMQAIMARGRRAGPGLRYTIARIPLPQ